MSDNIQGLALPQDQAYQNYDQNISNMNTSEITKAPLMDAHQCANVLSILRKKPV